MTPDEIADTDFFRDALRRSILTHDVLPDPSRKFEIPSLARWPFETNDAWEYADENGAKRPKYRPTAAEIDLCWQVHQWISLASQWRSYGVLRAKAYGFSFRQIAHKRGRSDEYWRRRYNDAVSAIQDTALKVSTLCKI